MSKDLKLVFEKEITDISSFKSPNKKNIRYSHTEGNNQLVINYDGNTRRYYPYFRDIKTGKQTPFYKQDKSKMDGKSGFVTLKEAKAQLIDIWEKTTREVKK